MCCFRSLPQKTNGELLENYKAHAHTQLVLFFITPKKQSVWVCLTFHYWRMSFWFNYGLITVKLYMHFSYCRDVHIENYLMKKKVWCFKKKHNI